MANLKKNLVKGFTVRTYTRPDGTTYEKLQYAFRLDDGRRVYVYGDCREECLEKAETRKKEEEKKKGYIPNEQLTLGAYFDECIAKSLRTRNIRQSTAHNKTVMFDARIRPVLGEKKIVDIQKREIEQLQLSLSERLSSSGVNLTMGILRELFSKAVIDEIIEKNPTIGILNFKRSEDEPTARETTHRALSDEEISLFFKAAEGTHYCNLFKFLLYSGVRIGEAGALRISDLDYKNNMININSTVSRISNTETTTAPPKTRAGKRQIYMSDELRKVISAQMRQNEVMFGRSEALNMNGLLFRSTQGEMIVEQRVNTCLQQTLKKINRKTHRIDRFTPHCFRATFISRGVAAGVEPTTLMAMVGHSDVRMTLGLYNHETTERIKEQTQLIRFA